jgi:hypothetical protein
MFNPLLPDLTDLKPTDLETKISELSKKYFIAARSGNSAVCEQILVILEAHKMELQKRNIEASKLQPKNSNDSLDSLINVS